MNKIKFIIILTSILFLSGCTATYEVNIKGDKVIEKLSLIETDQSAFDTKTDTGWTLRETFESLLTSGDQFSEENYKVKSLNSDSQLGIEYSSSYSTSILNSSVLNQCYINPSVTIVDDVVTIDTGSDFKCYEYYQSLDTIKVIFKTNHKVISTNAEIQDGDSYAWNFTKDSSKEIKISYYQSVVNSSINIFLIVTVIVIFIALFVGIYFVIKKSKDVNKI